MPCTCQALHGYLSCDGDIFGRIDTDTLDEGLRGTWVPGQLRPGKPLREPRPLFCKLDQSVADREVKRLMSASESA